MTDREIMQQALHHLVDLADDLRRIPNDIAQTIAALETELAKPEQKSISTNDHLCAMLRQVHDVLACTALPMKRQWVGLTNEEMQQTCYQTFSLDPYIIARAIESTLKDKNA